MPSSVQTMLSTVGACVLLSASAVPQAGALAQESRRPLPTLSGCLDRANTTVQMQACATSEFRRQDTRLNAEYANARGRLNPAQFAVLRQEQRAWLRTLDSECVRGRGSNASVAATLCRATATEHRADYLANYRLPGRPAPSSLSDWTGRWDGPEGLFIDVQQARGENRVRLVIKDNLDTEESYSGRFTGTTIQFERRGQTETIRRGSGAETGFSALRTRRNCLIVVAGTEGYCRRG